MGSKAPNPESENAGINSERAHLDVIVEYVENVGFEGPTLEGPVLGGGNGECDSTTAEYVVESGEEDANNMEGGNQERA